METGGRYSITRQRIQPRKQLLSLVNDVVMKNGGKPCTDELFVEFKVSLGGNPGNIYFFLEFFFEFSLKIRLSLGNT